MGLDGGEDVEIARLAVGLFAAAFDADSAAVFYAGGDSDLDGFDMAVAVDLQG